MYTYIHPNQSITNQMDDPLGQVIPFMALHLNPKSTTPTCLFILGDWNEKILE
jgi:hypothetical protein